MICNYLICDCELEHPFKETEPLHLVEVALWHARLKAQAKAYDSSAILALSAIAAPVKGKS